MDNEAAIPEQTMTPVHTEPLLAGFWVRGGAYFIDGILLATSVFLPLHGLGLLVGLAYRTIFISQGGQTPGKMAARIKVVTVAGEPVGIGRALARALAGYLSAFLLCIGYMIGASSEKRALHDYIAGTRVVYLDGVTAGRKRAFAALGVLYPVMVLATIGGAIYFGLGPFGKIKELAVKSGEGVTKGNLGSLRAALSISYGEAEGVYPATLDALTPQYIPAIPKTKLGDHKETDAWTPYGAEVCTGSTEYGSEIDSTKLKDTGGWGYVVDPKAKCYGSVFVDCTHQDTKGKRWPEY